jgi:hypothetical protein
MLMFYFVKFVLGSKWQWYIEKLAKFNYKLNIKVDLQI